MTVVRELINRISFKVNPSDKKNATDTIAKMDSSIKGLLTTAKLFGAALAGAVVAGAVQLKKFEESTAQTRFFARNKEEAEALQQIFADLAEASPIISETEGQEAAALASQLNISLKSIREMAPLLEKIDLARLDLDFAETTQAFSDAVKGDLSAFEQLIPGFKDVAEQLSKSRFGTAFGDITQQQRFILLLENAKKSEKELIELGKESSKTFTNAAEEVSESFSDAALKFGNVVKPAMIEGLKLANDLVEALQNSEPFWKLIGGVSDSIVSGIKSLRAVSAEFFENVKKGGIGGEKQGIFTGELTEDQTKLVEKLDERNKKRLKAASDFIKNTFFTFSLEGPKFRIPQLEDVKALEGTGEDFEGTLEAPTKSDFERTIDALKELGEKIKKATEDLLPDLPDFLNFSSENNQERIINKETRPQEKIINKETRPQEKIVSSIVISGDILLKNEDGTKVGVLPASTVEQLGQIFVKTASLKEGLNNVSANNGSTNVSFA